jgi:hypothetical protein
MLAVFGIYHLYLTRCGRYVDGGNYGGWNDGGLDGTGPVLDELWIYEVGISLELVWVVFKLL